MIHKATNFPLILNHKFIQMMTFEYFNSKKIKKIGLVLIWFVTKRDDLIK